MSQTIRIEDTTVKALTDRIAELEERLWVAYQNSGTPNDYDTWVAALLGGGENG